MIRSLWIILSTIAVANLLALIAFFGWLGATDRVNVARLEATRSIFGETLVEARLKQEQEEKARAVRDAEEAEFAKIGRAPLPADHRMDIIREYEEIARQREQRIQRETQDLRRMLLADREALEQDRATFEQERAEFFAMRDRLTQLQKSEQFEKTVRMYESLKPDQSRSMMASLIQQGQTEQVIAYLDAMQARTSSRVISEFQKEDPVMAANLLERLRTLGVEARATEGKLDGSGNIR